MVIKKLADRIGRLEIDKAVLESALALAMEESEKSEEE
jgi:hypothetical protein